MVLICIYAIHVPALTNQYIIDYIDKSILCFSYILLRYRHKCQIFDNNDDYSTSVEIST